MRRMFFGFGAAALLVAMAMPAAAQPIDGNTARKMLFSPRGFELVLPEGTGLSAAQQELVAEMFRQSVPGFEPKYYGAAAVSPEFFALMQTSQTDAAMSGLLQISGNYNNPETAARVAMAACETARGSRAAAPCVIAARLMPKKWQPQPLQMSADATGAFKAYRRGRGPKAMALSYGTTEFAIAKGDGAAASALATCNAAAAAGGAADCQIAVAD